MLFLVVFLDLFVSWSMLWDGLGTAWDAWWARKLDVNDIHQQEIYLNI